MSRETAKVNSPGSEWQEEAEFHCITCSDEALPVRVVSIDTDTATALVEVGNAREEVDISLVDAVAPGDLLLVHGGVALNNLGDGAASPNEVRSGESDLS